MAARQRRVRRLRRTARPKDQNGDHGGGGEKAQSDMANNDDGATQGGWREWQDLQAMHDLRAPDRNNAP